MNNEEQQTKQECRTLKKGAEHIKRQRMFESRSNEIKEGLIDEDTFARHRLTYSNNHLKENLLKSCKKNIDTHIQNLKIYKGNKAHGIFLIEYNEEIALSMAEVISVSDVNHGEPQIFDHYVFSKDNRILYCFYKI